jgi:hypothetical protein
VVHVKKKDIIKISIDVNFIDHEQILRNLQIENVQKKPKNRLKYIRKTAVVFSVLIFSCIMTMLFLIILNQKEDFHGSETASYIKSSPAQLGNSENISSEEEDSQTSTPDVSKPDISDTSDVSDTSDTSESSSESTTSETEEKNYTPVVDNAFVTGNYLKYRNVMSDGEFLYHFERSYKNIMLTLIKTDLNGNNKVVYPINNTWINSSPILYKDKIYYLDSYRRISVMNKDGSNVQYFEVNTEHFYNMSIDNDWVYFSTSNPHGPEIDSLRYCDTAFYKFRIDDFEGNTFTKICENVGYDFVVKGDWIYYNNRATAEDEVYSQDYLCRVKTDGSNKQVLLEEKVQSFIIHGNAIYCNTYYGSPFKGIIKINLDGSERTNVIQEDIVTFYVYNDYVYCYCSSFDLIYRFDIDGKNKITIEKDNTEYVATIFSYGGYIYYEYFFPSAEIEGGTDMILYRTNPDGTGRIRYDFRM